jgi:hypothetical protein
VYTLGGVIGAGFDANDSLLRYDPAANSWTAMAPAGVAGYGNYAGISPYGAGRLLGVMGGDTGFEPTNQTRIYTIATNTWSPGPPMLQARLAHAQDTLPDGRVIVASGYDGSATLPGVELLTPAGPCPTPSVVASATATSGIATATPTACTLQFTDVPPTNTFYPFVRCLACQGIISGYPCGGVGEPCNADNDPYFRPNNPVTRGQLAKIVSESAGFDDEIPPSQWTFTDVPYGSTFWVWVERLANREVMAGYVCGGPNEPCDDQNRPYFRPNNGATRGQLTKIVSNAAGFNDTIPPTQYTFTDVQPNHTFWVFVERLLLNRPDVMSGYVCGTVPSEPCDAQNRPYFRPNNPLTRGQTSKIVANTFFPNCNPPQR